MIMLGISFQSLFGLVELEVLTSIAFLQAYAQRFFYGLSIYEAYATGKENNKQI